MVKVMKESETLKKCDAGMVEVMKEPETLIKS